MHAFIHSLPALPSFVVDALFGVAIIALANLFRRVAAIYMLFVLPGTCAHEAAHYCAAILTNGRPRFPSLLPARTHSGWRLGSVQLGNARWYNAAFIALAPLLLLPLSGWLYLHRIAAVSLWQGRHWLYLYSVIVMSMSALPSRVDLQLACKHSAGVALLLIVCVIGYVLLRPVLGIG